MRRFATLALCALAATAVCTSALAWRVEVNPATIQPGAIYPVAVDGKMDDPPKRIHVKAEVMQGNLISQVQPVYPDEAKKARVEGKVLLDALIDKEGTVTNLRVVEGSTLLQQSALEAVRQWRYRPFLLNGNPIAVETTITVTYTLGK